MTTNKEELLANLEKPINFSIKDNLELAWHEFNSDIFNYVLLTLIGIIIPFVIGFFGVFFDNFHLLFGLLVIFLLTPTLLGTSICFHYKKMSNVLEWKNYFLGFQKIVPLFICQLIIIAIVVCISFPLIVVDDFVNPTTQQTTIDLANIGIPMLITLLLTTIALVYVTINFTFAFYFCYFYNLSALESIVMSYKYVKKNWFKFFALYLIYALLMFVGFLFLIVGVLVSIPVIRLASYHVFAKFTGYEREEIFTIPKNVAI